MIHLNRRVVLTIATIGLAATRRQAPAEELLNDNATLERFVGMAVH